MDSKIKYKMRFMAKGHPEGLTAAAIDAVHDDATARIASIEAELIEAARLAGKGSEREAALLGKVARLETRIAALEAEVAQLRDGLHNARYQLRRSAPLIFTNYPDIADDLSRVADRIDHLLSKEAAK